MAFVELIFLDLAKIDLIAALLLVCPILVLRDLMAVNIADMLLILM